MSDRSEYSCGTCGSLVNERPCPICQSSGGSAPKPPAPLTSPLTAAIRKEAEGLVKPPPPPQKPAAAPVKQSPTRPEPKPAQTGAAATAPPPPKGTRPETTPPRQSPPPPLREATPKPAG